MDNCVKQLLDESYYQNLCTAGVLSERSQSHNFMEKFSKTYKHDAKHINQRHINSFTNISDPPKISIFNQCNISSEQNCVNNHSAINMKLDTMDLDRLQSFTAQDIDRLSSFNKTKNMTYSSASDMDRLNSYNKTKNMELSQTALYGAKDNGKLYDSKKTYDYAYLNSSSNVKLKNNIITLNSHSYHPNTSNSNTILITNSSKTHGNNTQKYYIIKIFFQIKT